MSRSKAQSRLPIEDTVRIVLAVLAGEMTLADAARRHGVTPQAVGQWRDRFLEAGKASLESRMPATPLAKLPTTAGTNQEQGSYGGFIAFDVDEAADVVEVEHARRQSENDLRFGAQDGIEMAAVMRTHLCA
jgi:transposase-like protein